MFAVFKLINCVRMIPYMFWSSVCVGLFNACLIILSVNLSATQCCVCVACCCIVEFNLECKRLYVVYWELHFVCACLQGADDW